MTENQKAMRRIADELDQIETRAAELVSADPTDEGDKELRELAAKKKTLLERRSALAAIFDADDQFNVNGSDPDPETREFNALRSKVSVGRYLAQGIKGARLDGMEEEFRQATGCEEREIPIDAFEGQPVPEVRADAATAAPGTIGINMTSIVPAVFSQSVAEFLNIEMPRAASGQYSVPKFNANLTAGTKAKGGAQESTAATFTVSSAKPKRISARLTLRAEDLAEVGIPAFEASLRQNLQMVLSDALDVQCLRGDGQAPNLNGLATQLTDDTAQSNKNTFANAASDLAGYLDGKFAHELKDLRAIHNVAVYSYLSTLFATNDDSVCFLEWAGRMGIMQRANANMAASSSNVGDSIVVRAGMGKGKAGAGAVCPVWGNIGITDPYSDSGSATQHVSLHVLLGDVIVRYPGMYSQWKVKTA